MQLKSDSLQRQEVDEINGTSRDVAQRVMDATNIPRAAFAAYQNHSFLPMSIPKSSTDEQYHAASLSKPVFAYLVLKLIKINEVNTLPMISGKFKIPFALKTPLYSVYRDKQGQPLPDDQNPFLQKFTAENWSWAKKLDAEMALAHRTGLHIVAKEPYEFQFEPGSHYAYSGPGIDCLQAAMTEVTGSDLQTLAQEHVFGPQALDLKHTTFGDTPTAANSLKTTALEYARFVTAWVNDPALNYAFKPVVPVYTMEKDYFPMSSDKLVAAIAVDNTDRARVAWGLGVGLVMNHKGETIGAYHTGDMDEWRSGFGVLINPDTKAAETTTVYLANSHNGHVLAEPILPNALKPALNYFFPTYGFARTSSDLYGADFYGMNPKLLKPDLKEKAYQTKPITQCFKDQLDSIKKDDPAKMTPMP